MLKSIITIHKVCFLILQLLFAISCNHPNEDKPVKKNDQVRAEEIKMMNFGMFICWSYSTFSGFEWTLTLDKDADYFEASGCNTDQWCKVAKDAGMKYILFLTKHHDGFCLWDTKTTHKKVTNSSLGIDVLAKLKKSCEKYDLKLALYFSEGDWTWPLARDGVYLQGGYNPDIKREQLRELATNYGAIEFFWMDNAVGDGGLSHKETVEWIHKFQPDCFIGFNMGEVAGRIDLRERGAPGPIGDENAVMNPGHLKESYNNFFVSEFTYPIKPTHKTGSDWFYTKIENDTLCHSAEKIYKDYLGAKKYGNIFSLDLGPDYEGNLRLADIETLQKVGKYISGELDFEEKPE